MHHYVKAIIHLGHRAKRQVDDPIDQLDPGRLVQGLKAAQRRI